MNNLLMQQWRDKQIEEAIKGAQRALARGRVWELQQKMESEAGKKAVDRIIDEKWKVSE